MPTRADSLGGHAALDARTAARASSELPAARDRYTTTAIALHWIVAIVVVGQFAWGWWMQGIAKDPVGPRVDAFNLHKSVGLVLLALMLFRLGWRIAHPPPPLPSMPAWQALLARWNHGLLYLAIIVMPVSGYLGSVFSGYPVKWFGVTLPMWGERNPALKSLMSATHEIASFVLAAAVLLHVAAALRHAFARDGLVARMGIGLRSPDRG